MKNDQIVVLAEELLGRFRQLRAPINVEKIAEGLGISVARGNLGESTSGVIYREGRNARIGINDTQSLVRQRFTLAHELGHYMIHKDQGLWVDSQSFFRSDSSAGDPKEVEANKFAAELLMPRRLLERVRFPANDEQKADQLILSLARDFDVSVAAMSIRMMNLQLISIF